MPSLQHRHKHFGLLLSATRAAIYLGVGRTRFYELRKSAGFPAPLPMPSDGTPTYSREELRAWVRSLRAEGGAQ